MLQILVIEPQPRLAAMLNGRSDVRVIGTATCLWTVSPHASVADLIVLSAVLPQGEILKFLHQQHQPDPFVVVAEIDETCDEILPFLEAGAAGYVRRDATRGEIVSTLHAIYAGESPLAPPIGTALVERMHELLARQQKRANETLMQNLPNLNTLTAREHEILLLIRAGASNQEIAKELMIEVGTVKNHVHNILKKLNVARREQAAAYVDLYEQTTIPLSSG